MKKLFKVHQASKSIDLAILVGRVAIAVLMLVHGLPKMAALFSDGPIQFPAVFGLTPVLSLSLAVFAEVFCSVLLMTGFGTRLAVVPLIITMLVAVLAIHANDPFATQELGIHYLVTYVLLFMTGSGRYSLDYLLQANNSAVSYDRLNIEDPSLTIYQ